MSVEVRDEAADGAAAQAPWAEYMALVTERAGGRGLGRRLLAELERRARESGVTTIRLETNRALREAIALYRAEGYEEVAPFNDEPHAHHWFAKALGDRAAATLARRT